MKIYVCYYDDGLYNISLPITAFKNEGDAIEWSKKNGGDYEEVDLL